MICSFQFSLLSKCNPRYFTVVAGVIATLFKYIGGLGSRHILKVRYVDFTHLFSFSTSRASFEVYSGTVGGRGRFEGHQYGKSEWECHQRMCLSWHLVPLLQRNKRCCIEAAYCSCHVAYLATCKYLWEICWYKKPSATEFRSVRRLPSCKMWRRVVWWKFTIVSKEPMLILLSWRCKQKLSPGCLSVFTRLQRVTYRKAATLM